MEQNPVLNNSLSVPELLLLNEFNRRQYDNNTQLERKMSKVRQLIYKGYLRFTTVEETLSLLTISELKEILKSNGQTLKGNKNELVSRILKNIPTEKYSSQLPQIYIATERGQKELESRYYYIECCGFSISEISEMEKNYSGDEILEQLFSRDIVRHWNDANFGLLRNVYLTMHEFYKRRKRLKDSISALLAVIYFDLTGAENNGLIDNYDNIEWAFKTCLWDDLNKECDKLNLSSDDLMNLFEAIVSHIVVPPFSYFDVDTMKKIILDRLSGQMDLLERYKQFHKEPPKNREIIIKEFLPLNTNMLIPSSVASKYIILNTPIEKEYQKTPRMKIQKCTIAVQRSKGISLIDFPENYTMVDLETTGFSTNFDYIIEVGCIKYRNGQEVDRYQTLVKPPIKISPYMETITNITNEMVADAPKFEDIAQDLWNFLSGEIIVGHNVNFDINFLYDNFKRSLSTELTNDFVDTMRLAKKLLPELKEQGGYNLDNLCWYFNIKPISDQSEQVYKDEIEKLVDEIIVMPFSNRHRAIYDCLYTNELLNCLKAFAINGNIDISEIAKASKIKSNKEFRFSRELLDNIKPDKNKLDSSHIFYGKNCVFTGKLEEFQRSDAKQIVTNIGGHCESTVTKQTNFLIVGDMDYKEGLEGHETTKLKKSKLLIEKGQDLQIIPESAFYDLIEDYLSGE